MTLEYITTKFSYQKLAIWTNDICWLEFCINTVIDYNLYSILFTIMWSCVWQLFIKDFYDDDDDDDQH